MTIVSAVKVDPNRFEVDRQVELNEELTQSERLIIQHKIDSGVAILKSYEEDSLIPAPYTHFIRTPGGGWLVQVEGIERQ